MNAMSLQTAMIKLTPKILTLRQLNSVTTASLFMLERLRDELIRRKANMEDINLALLDPKETKNKH